MTSSSSQSNSVWSEDTEWLSAYLDHEITTEERVSLERRLHSEEQLQQELDGLRETIALLRDLPTLTPPRSFTLDPAQHQRRLGWGFHWRWASGMVALVCVVALTTLMMANVNEPNEMVALVENAPAAERADQAAPQPMMELSEQHDSSTTRQDVPAMVSPPNPLPLRSTVVPWATPMSMIAVVSESAHPAMVGPSPWSDNGISQGEDVQQSRTGDMSTLLPTGKLGEGDGLVNRSNRQVLAQEEQTNLDQRTSNSSSQVVPSWRLIGFVFLLIVILLLLVGVRMYRRRLV